MKSMPIDSQGLMGVGRECSLPLGGWYSPFERLHASQESQNLSISYWSLGHQYQWRTYSAVFKGPKCPTIIWACSMMRPCKVVSLDAEVGTQRTSSPPLFFIQINLSLTEK